MGSNFSFDISSEYDKAEMTNALEQAQREIASRYDFKGTSAALDWMDSDKTGAIIAGENDWQLDSIIELLRKKVAGRGQSQKILDITREPEISNLKMTKIVPFRHGLDQDKAKKITKLIREHYPKVKTSVQGEAVRVMSGNKDELQAIMQLLRSQDFDFPLNFTNFR